MPPKIIMQELRAPIHSPLAQDLERFALQHKNTSWAVAIGRSERADVNSFRPAVDGVWTRIFRARKNFFRLDHFDDFRFSRIRLGVDDMNTRRAQARHNQVPALDMWMRRIWTERRAARVPTEMVKFVAKLRHLGLADALAISARARINIHD